MHSTHTEAPLPNGDTKVDATDDILVERARNGDLRAFEALYRRHHTRTYALALRMTGEVNEAEEATQEAWVRAWERLHRFEGRSAFTTWLHSLTVNLLLDRRRSRGRQRERMEPLVAPDDLVGETGNGGAPAPDAALDRMELERAILALPEGARHIFVLHEVEGFKCREIARRIGRAEGTVKAQLHRARTLLREALT
jgi:RNA polymerase sigma-70 factor, ECF subfamily